jgi:hypothetical protein
LHAKTQDVLLLPHIPQALCATMIFPLSILKRLAIVSANDVLVMRSNMPRAVTHFIADLLSYIASRPDDRSLALAVRLTTSNLSRDLTSSRSHPKVNPLSFVGSD